MSDPFLGEIRMVGFNFAPYGWALCQGQTLPISQNQALFSLLGTTFGGNGTTNFQLPDLQGRMPMNWGNGPGLTPRTMGDKGGVENVSILISNMPAHTHVATFTPSGGGGTPTVTVQGSSAAASSPNPGGNYLAGTTKIGTGPTAPTGDLYVSNPASTTLGNIAGVSISGVPTGGGTVTNSQTGNNLPLATESPFTVVNFIIALQGVFPTRG